MMAEKSKYLKKKDVSYDDRDDERDPTCDSSPMKLNLVPRKKLLVLSIGGLLCHRVCRKDLSIAPIYNRMPDTSYGSYTGDVYKRPYCKDFMEFCLERFEVGIWSSAREWYMNNALDCIMDQNECTNPGFNSLETKNKPIFLKKLEKIWENKYSILFVRVRQYSSSNTLLIDTEPYKALLNPPNTAVFPTEYKASNVNDNALGPQGELRLYLDGLADAGSVTSYVKGHPFGQPAITQMHPDWNYYSKIIRRNSKT